MSRKGEIREEMEEKEDNARTVIKGVFLRFSQA